MSNDLNEIFGEEFMNTTVTVSVREFGDIVAQAMVVKCGPEPEDPKEAEAHRLVIRMLKDFGATIMTELFYDKISDEYTIEIDRGNS